MTESYRQPLAAPPGGMFVPFAPMGTMGSYSAPITSSTQDSISSAQQQQLIGEIKEVTQSLTRISHALMLLSGMILVALIIGLVIVLIDRKRKNKWKATSYRSTDSFRRVDEFERPAYFRSPIT